MSIASRIESIEGHIGDIYDSLELGGSDLTNVNKNIVNINSELIDRYKDYLANGTDELWNNWDKATETGVNETTINNTIKGKMAITPKGNTQQETTNGNQLIPFTNQDFTLSGVHFFVKDGILYMNGTSTGETSQTNNAYKTNFKFTLPAGTYYFTRGEQTGGFNVPMYFMKYSDNSYLAVNNGSFTLAEETEVYLGIYMYQMTFNNRINYTQLNTGSTEKTFESYTGGTASPNPSYPQEIKNVKGKNLLPFTNQDFTVNNVRYYVQNGSLILNGTSTGETNRTNDSFKINFAFYLDAGTYTLSQNNSVSGSVNYFFTTISKYNDNTLLVRSDSTTTSASFTLTEKTQVYLGFYVYQKTFTNNNIELMLEKNSVATPYLPYNTVEVKVQNKNLAKEEFDKRLNATGSGDNKTVVAKSSNDGQIIKVKPNTSYYAIGDFSGFSDKVLRLAMFNEYPVIGSVSTKFVYGNSNGFTFTTQQNTQYILLWNSYNRDTVAPNIFICETQYATSYIPHQEQNYPISLGDIELCKIGEYQDYIYKQNGNWYKYGAIGKIVLDGSEGWILSGSQPQNGLKTYYPSNFEGIELSSSPNLIYCNLLKGITTSQYSSASAEGIASNLTGSKLTFDVCLLNTTLNLAGWKTLLGTKNLIFYSPLATPTTTQITDTTLINQLNALEEAYSYNEQTNISQDGNLPFKLDITALVELS